jgi:hypothetical protein
MEVRGQLHALAALLQVKKPWIRGWVGPRAGLDAVERQKSLAPAGNRTPAVQPIAIPNAYYANYITTGLQL